MAKLMKASIIRKCSSAEDWKEQRDRWAISESDVVIEKVIMLEDKEFKSLCNDFFENRKFITDNLDSMWYDDKNKVWHCLAVLNLLSDIVILIESEGYDYARYTSVIEKADYIKEMGKDE